MWPSIISTETSGGGESRGDGGSVEGWELFVKKGEHTSGGRNEMDQGDVGVRKRRRRKQNEGADGKRSAVYSRWGP